MTVGYREKPKPLKSSVEVLAEMVKLLDDITTRHNREIGRLFERIRKLEEKSDGQAD